MEAMAVAGSAASPPPGDQPPRAPAPSGLRWRTAMTLLASVTVIYFAGMRRLETELESAASAREAHMEDTRAVKQELENVTRAKEHVESELAEMPSLSPQTTSLPDIPSMEQSLKSSLAQRLSHHFSNC